METAWNFRNTWVQVTKLPLKNFGFYGFRTIGINTGFFENPRGSGFFSVSGFLSPGFGIFLNFEISIPRIFAKSPGFKRNLQDLGFFTFGASREFFIPRIGIFCGINISTRIDSWKIEITGNEKIWKGARCIFVLFWILSHFQNNSLNKKVSWRETTRSNDDLNIEEKSWDLD